MRGLTSPLDLPGPDPTGYLGLAFKLPASPASDRKALACTPLKLDEADCPPSLRFAADVCRPQVCEIRRALRGPQPPL